MERKIEISEKTAERLVASGAGDAALFYMALTLCGGNEGDAAAMTGFSLPRLRGAREALKGLMDREELPEPPGESMGPRELITSADIAEELRKNNGFAQFKTEVERKLDTKLTTPSLAIVMNIYQNLGLCEEVLYLLLTYCIEDIARFYGPDRKPTVRQLEKEAYHWANEKIDSVERAEEYIQYKKDAQSKMGEVTRILGIAGRKPVRSEENYMTRWIGWGFGLEELELAYDKTVLKTGELNWKYMNSILRNWHEKGLHTIEDISGGDKKTPARQDAPAADSYEQEAIEWAKNWKNKNAH